MDFEMDMMKFQDVSTAFRLEKESFPPDEAASLQDIEYRARVAHELNQVARNVSTKEIVGFISASGAPDGTERMNSQMMKVHCVGGNVVCVHSVVVDAKLRRKGLGKQMLSAYVRNIKRTGQYDRIILMSKQYLVGFYESQGFRVIGTSSVSHGKDAWIDMAISLTPL
ncbi:unnamed protein product [Agarophyton chilense]|eukprot:gb/GEZJ01006055.1/.p1 GENE.gb/GEZJ01006055.1/~~gb/GEZJ01006055.1/.p1  ORF type:complete len:168 (+),score=27.83 gb/GEZJ01006055.1/:99-602(+)